MCLSTLVTSGLVSAETTTGSPAPSVLPAAPFDARVTREIALFRKAKPDANEDVVQVQPGQVFTVSKLEAEQTWKGEKSPVAAVKPHTQSTYYTLLSGLQPLGPGEVVSDTEAAALLSKQMPAASRSWCQRFTERLLLPASAGAGKAGALIYSASSDDACAGYMALVSGTGKEAQARALPRRGPLQSITVREVQGGPPLLDVEESLRGPNLSGTRRLLLSLERSGPRELLAVETTADRLETDSRHSVSSTMTLTPTRDGLDIDVKRTEFRVALATGAESERTESLKRYRYTGGKLTAQRQASGGK